MGRGKDWLMESSLKMSLRNMDLRFTYKNKKLKIESTWFP